MTFFRWCAMCEKRFNPTGKHTYLCINCRQKVRKLNFIKMINNRLERRIRI